MMSDSILLAFNSEAGLAAVPFVLKLIVVLTQLGTSSKDHGTQCLSLVVISNHRY